MPYEKDCLNNDVRLRAQNLRTHEINLAPYVPGATLRADIIAKYPDGRYKVFDFTAPNFIKGVISYKEFAWHYGHTYDNDDQLDDHNANTFNNVTLANSGSTNPPRDITYPETVMIVLNGNFNIAQCRAFPVNQYGLTHKDWRLSRNNAPDPIHNCQWTPIGCYSNFFVMKFNQREGLRFILPACSDSAYNQYNSGTLAEIIWETVKHKTVKWFTGERQAINWFTQENLAYPDSANFIASRAEANYIGNGNFSDPSRYY
ncbi:polyhedrin [Choristoneura occidentalis cypovirus 16]|uniref:Polyhedrin n=1 Tax=Choristoneura fumiferana cypovirus TaxID=59730 RepID=A8W984_CPVCS|nr:polyhedrin [Choristoneura occidentalis cypovirus 16]ABW87644.1 polyhedrin [Choristoneura occidentalis cypovirus 16]